MDGDYELFHDFGFYGALWGNDDPDALKAFTGELKRQGLEVKEIAARLVDEAKRRGYVKAPPAERKD